MAYVNVAEWKPDQVTEWLKGLDHAISPYLHLFIRNEVSGQQLLNVQPDDLDHWGVRKLGHQELILEAVEHLRNFHYELDRENLQLLALRLSCQANSLHNELCKQTDSQPLCNQTLADVASVVRAVKPLVCWLDRSPFSGPSEYAERKTKLLKHSIEIAICAQRDRFAERPVEEIRANCAELAALADSIIQDINDSLILQPASLDLATLKKRGSSDLGFFILPSFHGVHQVCKIKFGSPAHQCGKVEEGDEVVQVNYQTVVGWQQNKVMALFEESPADVFLTLKKRPRHTKVYGQIYMKPYRLPSKKRAAPYTRWHDNLPSPRPELLTIPDFELPLPKTPPQPNTQIVRVEVVEPAAPENPSVSSESDDDGIFMNGIPDEGGADFDLDGHASPTSMRLYLPKPRVPVQRRATITGASPTSQRPPVDLEKFWRELKLEKRWRGSDPSTATQDHSDFINCRNRRPEDPGGEMCTLRDKSASLQANFPREQTERPSTCLGIEKLPLERPLPAARNFAKHTKSPTAPPQNSAPTTSDPPTPPTPPSPPTPKPREGATSPKVVEESVRNAFEVFGARRNKPKSPPSRQSEDQISDPDPRKQSPCIESKLYISRLELQVNPNDVEESDGKEPVVEEEEDERKEEVTRKMSSDSQVGELPSTHHRERGRLDKSHSTPAYDLNLVESEVLEMVRERKVSRVKEEADGSHVTSESALSDEPPPVSPRQFKPQPEPDSPPEIRINDSNGDQMSRLISDQDMLSMKFDEALPVECAYAENDSPSFSSSLWGESPLETNTSDYCNRNCEVGTETESHGRVVETINRHLLVTNLGKEDDDSSSNSVHSETEDACYNKGLSSTTPDLVTDTQNRRNLSIGEEPADPNREQTVKPEDGINVSPTKLDNQNQNHIHISPEKPETRTESIPDNVNAFSIDKDGIGCSKIGLILNTINNALKEESLKEYKFSESEETARVPILNVFPRKECGSVHPVPKNTNMYCKERHPDGANAPAIPPIIQRQPKMLAAKVPNKISLTPPEPPPRPPTNQGKSNLSIQVGLTQTGPSPTGGLRAMRGKGSAPKGLFSGPKKNPLLAKRRDIGVRDLGTPDCQGCLSRRLSVGGSVAQWVKGWFVLKGTTFYGFKNKEAQKADCFISLPGFTISQAGEVKSRRHAFKVYHTGTAFYFAAESEEDLSQWLDRLSAATLAQDTTTVKASYSEGAVFSETEDEGDEPDPTESCFPSPKMRKLANFLSGHSSGSSGGGPSPKPARSHQNLASSTEPKIYEIQKKFGSLKKLGYRGKQSVPPPSPSPLSQVSGSASSLNTTDTLSPELPPSSQMTPPSAPHSLDRKYLRFLSSSKNQNIPVPTAQFRSYRRVVAPENSCSTLPAGTKIADNLTSGQAAGSSVSGATALPGYPSNAGVYEQHRLPGERGQGVETPGSFRGRPFLHQSAESVLGNYDEAENSHPPPSTSPRPAVPPRRDLMSPLAHGEVHTNIHSNTPSLDMNDYRLTASGRRARRLNMASADEMGNLAPNRPDIDRRHPHRTPGSQLEGVASNVNLPSANEAYAGYTEDPVSSLQRQQASLERRRNSPPPPPVARTRGSPSAPVPAPRPTPPSNAPASAPTTSAPPVARRTPVTTHRQKKNSDRQVENPSNQTYRGGSPDNAWMDPVRQNKSNLQRQQATPPLPMAIDNAAGVSAVVCGLHGLKNAALYQPPPVAFGAQSSFGTTFEMNLDQRVLSGEATSPGDSMNSRTKTTSKLRQLFSPRHGQSSPPHGHKSTVAETPQRGGGLGTGHVSGHQKTLLGSPGLHRAFFRNTDGRKQKPGIVRSDSRGNTLQSSFGAGGSQQSTSLSSSPSSSSISSPDWPQDSYGDNANASSPKPTMGVAMLGKKPFPVAAPRNIGNSPHNPLNPPPDYPGLEYPPVFEPGTYSLSDTSTLLQRTPSRQDLHPSNLNGHNERSPYS